MRIKNGLAVGVILLFIGVAVQPSVATVQLEKIDVEPDIEGLVAQLRDAVNEKLEKYESIPKVAGFWNIFWDIVDYLLGLLEKIGFYLLDLFEKIGTMIVVFILLLLFNILFL